MFQGPDEVQHLAMIAQVDRNHFAHYKNDSATTWADFERSYDYKEDFYHQAGILTRPQIKPKYSLSGIWGIDEEKFLHQPGFDDIAGTDNFRHNTYTYPPLYYGSIALPLTMYRQLFSPRLVEYQFLSRLFGFMFYWVFIVCFSKICSELMPKKIRKTCIYINLVFTIYSVPIDSCK